jgi:hypothetical protein
MLVVLVVGTGDQTTADATTHDVIKSLLSL